VTKNEKKQIIKGAKAAGLKDEALIAEVIAGLSIEEALKKQAELTPPPSSQDSNDGKNLAGTESGEASGSAPQGTTTPPESGSDDSSKDSEEDADDENQEEQGLVKKAYHLSLNLLIDGVSFNKGEVVKTKHPMFKKLLAGNYLEF
jgi:hypothetical protein